MEPRSLGTGRTVRPLQLFASAGYLVFFGAYIHKHYRLVTSGLTSCLLYP